MVALRSSSARRFLVIAPLSCLSAAWTVQLAGSPGLVDVTTGDNRLPDGASVPTEALEDPASFTIPGQLGLGIRARDAGAVVQASSTNGIPSAALAAYQRAETVINAADKACNIDWQLIAAIGRVESDHGRYGGSVLDREGVSRPGIYGIALDGTNETQAIRDTDAGQYDRDQVWDRAVGAMQFIPSTWSVVGVDADGDGARNPQDIDDAALAAAAYLCSGADDLGSTDVGRRAAVFRYNHSQEYVDLVLAVREAYLEGDYAAVPNYTASAVTFAPEFSSSPVGMPHTGNSGRGSRPGQDEPGSSAAAPGGADSPNDVDGGGADVSGGSPDDEGVAGGDEGGAAPEIAKQIEKTVDEPVRTVRDTVDAATQAARPVLTLAEAAVLCTAEGYSALLMPTKWNTCIAGHTH